MSCAERKVAEGALPGQNKFLTCPAWLMGRHMGYCDPHTAPGPAMEKEEQNQDLGISWAWDDGPFKPKGRGKMDIMQEKLGNDTGQKRTTGGLSWQGVWKVLGYRWEEVRQWRKQISVMVFVLLSLVPMKLFAICLCGIIMEITLICAVLI